MRKRRLLSFPAFAVGLCSTTAAAFPCKLFAPDQAWIAGALHASDLVRARHLRLPPTGHPTIILFDRICRFEAVASPRPRWVGAPHGGKVRIPDGSTIPAAVTSFSGQAAGGEPFFVMALPSVWQAAKVPIAAERYGLTGVFLHEYQHVAQTGLMQPLFDRAKARLPKGVEDPDDDSLQRRFATDPRYRAAYEKERDLLFRAATAPGLAASRRLARQALASMRARQARWFVGADAYWKPYDDLFLTLEGVGQWTGVAWLADRRGGAMTPLAARNLMRGSRKWWSQEEGLALFLTIDRLMPGWPARAFARNPELGIDLLDEAVNGARAAAAGALEQSELSETAALRSSEHQMVEDRTVERFGGRG